MEEPRTNPCGICGKPVPYQGRGRPQAYCSPEHKAEFRQRRVKEAYYLQSELHRYGLTVSDYEKLLKEQRYACAICGATDIGSSRFKRWYIDHDHNCCPRTQRKTCGKCNRALLCMSCNFGLGHFRDDSKLLEAAVAYLQKWGQKETS